MSAQRTDVLGVILVAPEPFPAFSAQPQRPVQYPDREFLSANPPRRP